MTKPHEEEWEQDAENPEWVNYKAGNDSGTVARFGTAHGREKTAIPRARLASKAPKMARALMYARDQFYMQLEGNPEWHRKGRVEDLAAGIDALLREAGVLE